MYWHLPDCCGLIVSDFLGCSVRRRGRSHGSFRGVRACPCDVFLLWGGAFFISATHAFIAGCPVIVELKAVFVYVVAGPCSNPVLMLGGALPWAPLLVRLNLSFPVVGCPPYDMLMVLRTGKGRVLARVLIAGVRGLNCLLSVLKAGVGLIERTALFC